MNLNYFKTENIGKAVQLLFNELNIPVNKLTNEPANPDEILVNTFKAENDSMKLMDEIYVVGMVDDAAFEERKSLELSQVKEDYEGILLFGVTLKERTGGYLPTRTQLAEITRAFNREFHYNPVVVVFKYSGMIAFSNCERVKYKQEWREGEKVGKVSVLRDIQLENTHSGHLRILQDLKISRTGNSAIDSFSRLYKYWQDVLSISILNKKFYEELQRWYFWAIKEVKYPNAPNRFDFESDNDFDEAVKEHKGKNVIRLLTRILFVWFIKEKKLIPERLFEENYIAENLLKNFTPQKPQGIFATGKNTSMYYRAILQNLFFATLNQEMGKREFRKDGDHMNVTNLMRYKSYFKDGGSSRFIEIVEKIVPFMNGGLFECLDKPHPTMKGKSGGDIIIYEDGFSDREDNILEVPDYLFFDVDEEVDISKDIGLNSTAYKKAKTRGLLEILKSYKFTITENTPIEEDIALDPELLGKVFENLLASYNPETKTTARKQTGSFYTPREIVNYMVDETIIEYLKKEIDDWGGIEENLINKKLHDLLAFDNTEDPFEEDKVVKKKIIEALDNCKILDPACGSGAFPMGILQKMVHVLHKVDRSNYEWKQRQINRVNAAIEQLEEIEDGDFREKSVKELEFQKNDIEEAFSNNELDYGRKLYLIENCIYGIDIQSIATQISKLRFFISLVVDQKIDKGKYNFGIRPLPNLETKFVSANTLIGLEKNEDSYGMFETPKIVELKGELKKVRHKLFNAKTPKTKRKYREIDENLRNEISNKLIELGYPGTDAERLAKWDPYDQNATSAFFDMEWMFDVSDGFDIIIGNPPYIKEYTDRNAFNGLRKSECYQGKMDLWYLFGCKSIDLLCDGGLTSFIATNNWITNEGASKFRNKVLRNTVIKQFLDFRDYMIFESASIQTMVYVLKKEIKDKYCVDYRRIESEKSTHKNVEELLGKEGGHEYLNFLMVKKDYFDKRITFVKSSSENLLEKIKNKRNNYLDEKSEVAQGIVAPQDYLNKKGSEKLNWKIPTGTGIFFLNKEEKDNIITNVREDELFKPFYTTDQLDRYYGEKDNKAWVIYTGSEFKNERNIQGYPNIKKHLDRFRDVITSDNRPYGLHRARNEYFFKGEKIIVLRKCTSKPIFTYTEFDCYVSQTFYVIKTQRIDQKYLVGLLNSKLIEFWLRNKGKMQGKAYQIDKGPILEIPIFVPEDTDILTRLVDEILINKGKVRSCDISEIEKKIDEIVYKLYDLTDDEIKIIENEIK